jgi:hypothetical protein
MRSDISPAVGATDPTHVQSYRSLRGASIILSEREGYDVGPAADVCEKAQFHPFEAFRSPILELRPSGVRRI